MRCGERSRSALALAARRLHVVRARRPSRRPLADATDNLVAQTGKLPVFLARIESTLAKPDPKQPKRAVTIDPMLDTITGQQTETTMLFERRVTQRIGNAYPQFEFLPFQAANLSRAQYLLTGTLSRVPTAPIEKPTVRLSLALIDLQDRPRRRPGVGAGARGEPRQHAVALLPRQPGADQGQGRRGLRQDDDDAGRPARRRRTTWSGSARRA